MSSLRTSLIVVGLTAVAAVSGAQQPTPAPNGPPNGPPPAGRRMGPGARVRGTIDPAMQRQGPPGEIASLFLAHTGELKLSDQQVTRLAAIARRAEERRTAQRAAMDSVMRATRAQQGQPGQPGQRGFDQMRIAMDRARAAERADVRDALAVLTPDQLVDAWMLRDGPRRGVMRLMGPGGPAPRQD